jgi:hypothetical protein
MRMRCFGVYFGIMALVALYGTTMLGQNNRFVRDTSVAGKPVVVDTKTGLIWQGCTAGQTGDDCTIDSAEGMTWQEALAYCAHLKWGDDVAGNWRLPSVVELSSILDDRESDPFIDIDAFPITGSDYWSSSSIATRGFDAWYVGFDSAEVYFSSKGLSLYVRCVRSGP